jgi:UDP-N-acetyl-D-galactosamine dehydrogenase
VVDIVRALEASGIKVQVHDALASREEVRDEYGIALTGLDDLRPADAVVLAVAHDEYARGGWPLVTRLLKNGSGVVLDVKAMLDRAARPAGIELWRL